MSTSGHQTHMWYTEIHVGKTPIDSEHIIERKKQPQSIKGAVQERCLGGDRQKKGKRKINIILL